MIFKHLIPSLTEASHKVLRFASKHLARQNDNEKNAYDCFMHLWFVSDPLVRAEFEVDSDSDDSLPGGIDDKTSGDLDDIDLKDVPKFTEDLENMMSGTKIVPKALPKPLPEGSASVNSNPQSRQHNSNKAIKRRHSGRDGMFSNFFF